MVHQIDKIFHWIYMLTPTSSTSNVESCWNCRNVFTETLIATHEVGLGYSPSILNKDPPFVYPYIFPTFSSVCPSVCHIHEREMQGAWNSFIFPTILTVRKLMWLQAYCDRKASYIFCRTTRISYWLNLELHLTKIWTPINRYIQKHDSTHQSSRFCHIKSAVIVPSRKCRHTII